jgi:hypothetical protein
MQILRTVASGAVLAEKYSLRFSDFFNKIGSKRSLVGKSGMTPVRNGMAHDPGKFPQTAMI